MQNSKTMALTELQKQNIRRLSIEDKVEILHECADEFMTADEYHEITKIPRRTIYAKFGTFEVKGFEFCGHKLFYL